MKTLFPRLPARIFALALIPALGLFGVGCGDDEDGSIVGPGPDMGGGAMVRIVHSSPDAPVVDIYAEGVATPLARNLAYGDATPYLELAPADYNIQLRAAGAAATDPIAFETGDLTIPAGAKITAIAMGLFGSTDDADKFRVQVYAENFAVPGAGKAAVRIVHASPNAPTVALDLEADGVPEVSDFTRFSETGAAGVPVDAGRAVQVAIWAGDPLQKVTVFTTPELPAGAELFVLATGLLGELPREAQAFNLLAVGPAGAIGFVRQNPVVFALHASPDAPAVDIYAGAARLVDDLGFGQLSAPIQVAPGSYDLGFTAFNSEQVVASALTPSLVAGERYLAIASGFLSSGTPQFELLPYVDQFAADEGIAQVRVIHASPDAPAVDVGTFDGTAVTPVADFTNLLFRGDSPDRGTELPIGTLPIGIAAAGSSSPEAIFDVVTATGLRAFVVAAGSFNGAGENFRLIVVDTASYPWTAASILPRSAE